MVERMPLTKRARLVGRVGLGQLHRLVDHHSGRWAVGVEQLGDGEPQHQAVDDGHALERPADRGGGDAPLRLLFGGDSSVRATCARRGPAGATSASATVTGSTPLEFRARRGATTPAHTLLVAGGGVASGAGGGGGGGGTKGRLGPNARNDEAGGPSGPGRVSPERVSTLITSPVVHEERHLDDETGLQRGRLAGARARGRPGCRARSRSPSARRQRGGRRRRSRRCTSAGSPRRPPSGSSGRC